MFDNKKRVIVVDGIISAGKTTYINMLNDILTKKGYKIAVVKEPVEKWKSNGILERFYKDPARWGYHFQTVAFFDRINENIKVYEDNKDADIFILERSPFTDMLFMSLLFDEKLIDDLEMANYREWAALWLRLLPYSLTHFIYLSPNINVCMNRLHERNRKGEESVSKDYQSKLKQKHDEFFSNKNVTVGDKLIPVLKIESDDNFRDDQIVRESLAQKFIDYLFA